MVDAGKLATCAIVIQAIADDKMIGDAKACVVDLEMVLQGIRFDEQTGQSNGLGLFLLQLLHEAM